MDNFYTKKMISIITYITFSLICLLYMYNDSNSINIQLLNIVSIINILISTLILVYLGNKIYSLPVLFLFFSYVFHFGQLPIHAFNLPIQMPWPVKDLLGEDLYFNSLIYSYLVQNVLTLALIVFGKSSIGFEAPIHYANKKELKTIVNVGLTLIFIGIIPTLYYETSRIIFLFNNSYNASNINPNGYISFLISMFYNGIIIIIVGLYNQKKKATIVAFSAIVFLLIMMATGARGEKAVRIVVILCVYLSIPQYKKITLKKIFLIGFTLYIGLIIVNFIGDFRTLGATNLFNLKNLKSSLNNNQILEALAEFGGTQITVGYAQLFTNNDFLYGSTYVKGISMLFINIGGIIDSIRPELIYIMRYPIQYQAALGGSYIGELYVNFGYYGLLVAPVIGFVICKVDYYFRIAFSQKRLLMLTFMIVTMGRLLWWVRDYYANLLREIIWGMALIYIIYEVVKFLENRRKLIND